MRLSHPDALLFSFLVALVLLFAPNSAGTPASLPEAARAAGVAEVYGELPLSFEANEGQVDRAVRFLCRGRGHTLFLTPNEAVLSLRGARRADAVVRLRLAGANGHPRMEGAGALPTRSNYLLGDDPRRWHTGLAHYARVRVADVYPGVDMVFRESQRQLEYDLVLAPGADPRRIRLAFEGAESITIGALGELILHTANGDLLQHAPAVFQEAGDGRQQVEGHYVLLAPPVGVGGGEGARHQVGLVIGRYDRGRPLIIDPVLAYSTFLGGSGDDVGYSIAIDGAGNAYITGQTPSATFPGVSGGSLQPGNGGGLDAFVTKIDPTGTAILYSTFLGGGGDDVGLGIAVDTASNAYVTGQTTSTTFPGVGGGSLQPASGGGGDGFVTKLDATGSTIVYSTFLGGSGFDRGYGIAVDGAGNAYVTGQTASATFPGVSGSSLQPANGGGGSDAFVMKINPGGSAIVYSTFLGGGGTDLGIRIAVDGSGSAYVTGETTSTTFPGVGAGAIQPANGGGLDAFVTKIDPGGSVIVYSTFLGGTGTDAGNGIAVDGEGNAYVAGETASTTFPGVSASSIQPANAGGAFDAFLTKIDPTGSAIVYSTFLGGSGSDDAFGLAIDGAGNAYLTGRTDSTAFPGVSGTSLQPANGGGAFDAFVTKINPAGSAILYSTFLGGTGDDEGQAIAVDGAGNAYVAGQTSSSAFPGVSGSSLQPANGGGSDAFVTKIAEAGLAFHTVLPCRLVDTRNAVGPLGGPALQPGATRIFALGGACGVPASAKALSLNVTVAQPAAAGDLRLLPGDQTILPLASAIDYALGQTRANNAITRLAFDGSGRLKVKTDSAGSVHLVLDVNGYFQTIPPAE
jgi:YD repeat-containing protein